MIGPIGPSARKHQQEVIGGIMDGGSEFVVFAKDSAGCYHTISSGSYAPDLIRSCLYVDPESAIAIGRALIEVTM
jgi:hypothetical protein